MKFRGREMKDWQQQVWDAKEKIYQETRDQSFEDYLAYIRKGAEAFLTEGRLPAKGQGDGQ